GLDIRAPRHTGGALHVGRDEHLHRPILYLLLGRWPVLGTDPSAELTQQDLQRIRQLSAGRLIEPVEQRFLVAEQLADDALVQLPPRLGQRDHHRPTVVAGSIPHHETGRLGTGDPLRYRSGGAEAALGDLPRGELVWRATTAQGAQQVEGRTVSAEALQGPASLVGEQLRQPPDPGDDPDRLDRHVRQLAAPRRLNPIGAVLVPCCHAAQPALRLVTPINLALKEFAWLHGPSSSPGAEPASAAPSRSRSPPTATPSSSPAGDGNDSSEPSPRSDRPYGRSTSTRRTRWP